MNFITKGGWVMWGLIPASILVLAIFLDRLRYFMKVKKQTNKLLAQVKESLQINDMTRAVSLCKENNTPMGNLLFVALENKNKSKEEIQKMLEESSKTEIPRLERYLGALGTIATISPMLGLLGTVTGMIKAFNTLAVQGTGNPAALAGGISEALITTATGLIIAIPTVIIYNYFTEKVNKMILNMEVESTALIETMHSQGSSTNAKKWSRL